MRYQVRHGMTGTRTHNVWSGLRARCLNKNAPAYGRYGGRGIEVCERWLTFENFLEDMGVAPEGMSLDRINNDLGYELSNCRWATPHEQSVNRRNVHLIEIDGRTLCLTDWAIENGIAPRTAWARLKAGWDPVMAVTIPTMKRRTGIEHGRKFYETRAWAVDNGVTNDEREVELEPA